MHALTQTGFGGPDVVRPTEVAEPTPARDEVLVRLRAVSTCYVDTAVRRGLRGRARERQIPGHEGAGTVEAAGQQATLDGWHVGDRVLLLPRLPCGRCEDCGHGQADLCPKAPMLGQERPGTHAEFVAVPSRMLMSLPDNVPYELGAIAGCTVSTAIAGIRRGDVRLGETVVVRGATGGIGIYVSAFAKAAGARRVIGLTRSEAGAQYLTEAGFEAFVVDGEKDDGKRFTAQYPERTDCFIDLVGGWRGEDYTRWVRRGGTLVLLGDLFGETVSLNPSLLIYRGVRILTALCGTPEMAQAGLDALHVAGFPSYGTVLSGTQHLQQLHTEVVDAPGKRIVMLPLGEDHI